MDNNEIMVNEEVMEATEIATSGKGFKIAAGIGLAAIGGLITYKFIIKPIITKIKSKYDGETIELKDDEFEFEEIDEKTE